MSFRDPESQDVIAPFHGEHEGWGFYCPGCRCLHSFDVALDHKQTPKFFGWNGDCVRPTFTPWLLYPDLQQELEGGGSKRGRCHLFVRDGNIQFLDDCTHELAGKTVPLSRDNFLFK